MRVVRKGQELRIAPRLVVENGDNCGEVRWRSFDQDALGLPWSAYNSVGEEAQYRTRGCQKSCTEDFCCGSSDLRYDRTKASVFVHQKFRADDDDAS